ncbi:hypothetical protein [Dinghuibacter silviterrae]|uniref:Uncharacterized protein n=1 Tax=Dinghuibacter silviterrae TaxID=1539049 RepID=A0A4R8DU08_9BACT|nr:hypothetical protein [Dinghuibacter silviterrae]TDX00621.1 hypothetical protein EDB95_1646 [Dinghuibacter silviterrae]
MSHYTIHLPTGEQADVRQGFIIRKTLQFWRKAERKKAYFVQVGQQQYRLLRSMDGTWLSAAEGDFQPTDGHMSDALKEAITRYEQR